MPERIHHDRRRFVRATAITLAATQLGLIGSAKSLFAAVDTLFGAGAIVKPRLYQLIRQPNPTAERRFEIEFLDPGVGAFDFTFG